LCLSAGLLAFAACAYTDYRLWPMDLQTSRYPVLPAALVGRLAVDEQYRRKSLGAALLFDAFQRAARAEPAVFALIVDAKDENAAAFYSHFEFRAFISRPMTMFLPIATAAKLLPS